MPGPGRKGEEALERRPNFEARLPRTRFKYRAGARPGMLNGRAYLDRAAPRLTPEKLLVSAFTRGPFIEPVPGLYWPGLGPWPGRSTLASGFLAFCAAFAFARWRALALVMSSSPYSVAWWSVDDPLRRDVQLCGGRLARLPPRDLSPKMRAKPLSGEPVSGGKAKVASQGPSDHGNGPAVSRRAWSERPGGLPAST